VRDDEVMLFDKFYEALSKWAISQDQIPYVEFSQHENELAREEEKDAFKKMADRIV
jgi:hypothetical protein